MTNQRKDNYGNVKWYHGAADFANIFKAFIGTNYLGLSYGFSQSGLVFGLLGLLVVSILTNHCCKLIVKCKHHLVNELCTKYEASNDDPDITEIAMLKLRLARNMDYADVGRLVFGKWGSRIVNIFVIITQCVFCVGYVIFIGNVLQGFFPKVPVYVNPIVNITNSSTTEGLQGVFTNYAMRLHKRDALNNSVNDITSYRMLDSTHSIIRNESRYHLKNNSNNFISNETLKNISDGDTEGLVQSIKNTTLIKNLESLEIHPYKLDAPHEISAVDKHSDDNIQIKSRTDKYYEEEEEFTHSPFQESETVTSKWKNKPELITVNNETNLENATEEIHFVYNGPSLTLLSLIPLPLFILFTYFRTVRQLGIISILANASILIGFTSVLTYILIELKISEEYSLFGVATLPVYIAQVIGAYEAIGTIIPIESSMEENSHNFPMAINVVVIVFTCLIGVMASFGYLQYGADTKQIIAQNLPSENPVVMLINVTLMFGVLCTYPLQIYPVVEIFEGLIFSEGRCCGPQKLHTADIMDDMDISDDELAKASLLPSNEPELVLPIASYVPKSVKAWKRNLFRTLVAIVICGIGILFRNVFAYVGALGGAIGSCPLAFILPCLFHLKIHWGKAPKLIVFKDIAIIVFGVVCGVIGFIITIQEIVYRL